MGFVYWNRAVVYSKTTMMRWELQVEKALCLPFADCIFRTVEMI